jgi:ABC-type uncharacterized transport system auxiliary subunit
MTGRAVTAVALLLCAGCLSSSTPAPKTWIVAPANVTPPTNPTPGAFSVTRQGALTVTAPFDSTAFVVRRADGSVARDPYNVFASPPSTLLRAAVRARLEADGRFGRVVPQSSSASADVQVEVLVRDLSLDCSNADRRAARAAVSIDVLRAGRGARVVILSGDGDGTGDAEKGDYSAAFSQAFDAALVNALRALKEQPPPQPLEPTPKGEQK